ncbi:concanavalin A-like lectin/glucanase [Guyanagaster necrorhizus]|uniref:Concanavalin A-like lectin/glucanase n=1 Tax=Guyanagaster necrorhizus TaxID=856835 RepID=A0A9P7VH59_9AGAR|nr:concanavalin A-like lectin/glucanase [Guyanagaster necrorhizus MCA 3950]KAG7440470.1 concanavalin A-like lectin/glucanase [Guyanagaster necrorhizus MCA 3950]
MLSLSILTAFVCLTPFVIAAPSELQKRVDTTTYCGQYDSVDTGTYTLYLDQWGKDNADSGSDCASVTSTSGTNIAWTTTWTWSGGSGVKSFTNINVNDGLDVKLSAISSIKSSWTWTQTTSGTVVADIAYDMFTSSTSGGSNEYEIMVWLDNINAGAISYTYGSDGSATPIVSSVTIAGYTWDLYYGSNGSNYVYSFLTADGSAIKSFSADLMDFFDYLTSNEGLSTSQYLTTVQGGTEATSGSATLTS